MSSKIKVDTIENVAGSGNVSLGSGHNLVVPGNETVGGTLGVTGVTTLTGTLGVGTAPNATFGSHNYTQGTPAVNKPIISGYSQGNSNNAGFALFNDSGNRGIWTTGSTMRFTRTYEGNSTSDMNIDANGHITAPNQPAFLADCNYTGSNLAINASHTVPALNERFDQNSDYNNSTYTFTAPVTGKYQLNANFYVHFFDDSTNYVEFLINTSNRVYRGIIDNSLAAADVDNFNNGISVLADMDASDTAHMQINIPNSGAAQMRHSNLMNFSGYLVA